MEILPWYVENLLLDLQAVKAALAAGDWPAIGVKGHQMRGSGLSFGYGEITDIGGRLESAVQSGQMDSLGALVAELEEIIRMVEREQQNGQGQGQG
jgi:HPt (histidine-containing phosphotransfer) domain-containing protein